MPKKAKSHYETPKSNNEIKILDMTNIVLRENLRKGIKNQDPGVNLSGFRYQDKYKIEAHAPFKISDTKLQHVMGELAKKKAIEPIAVKPVGYIENSSRRRELHDIQNGRHRFVSSMLHGYTEIPTVIQGAPAHVPKIPKKSNTPGKGNRVQLVFDPMPRREVTENKKNNNNNKDHGPKRARLT